MSMHDLSIFDPPVGSQILVQVSLTNNGSVAADFFIQGISAIIEQQNIVFNDIQDIGIDQNVLNPETGTFDEVIPDEALPSIQGELGTINVAAGQTRTVQFITEPLQEVGLYTIGFRAGIFDFVEFQIVEVQDELIAQNVIEIFEPATAILSNFEVIGEA